MREGFDGFFSLSRRCGVDYQYDFEVARSSFEMMGMIAVKIDLDRFEDFIYDFPTDPWMQNEELLERFKDEGVRAVLVSPDLVDVHFFFDEDDDEDWWAWFKLKYF